MEPVSDIIGHCFVVGDTRHQLRASMSAGWRGSARQVRRNFRQLSPHRTTGKNVSQLSPHRTTGKIFTVVPPHSCPPTGPLDFFFTVVGLDNNLDIFSWEESRPWRGLGRRLLRQARQAPSRRPSQSPASLLYVLYALYGSQGKPLNIHSPPGAICALWLLQGKPLHIHSSRRVPCYMRYMCYMGLIAHIVHIARSWGRK